MGNWILAGFAIVMPLIVGMISKYVIVWPLNVLAHYLPFSLFAPLNNGDFTFAFVVALL